MFKIHHIALTAKDLNISSNFYDKIFGLFEYKRHNSSEKVCSWLPPSPYMPELLIYSATNSQKDKTHQLYDPGIHHFCFQVPNIELVDQVFSLAKSLGATILDEPEDYPRYAQNVGGSRYYAVYFNDPDGIKLEFAWIPIKSI